jgi:hypothetical protein
MADVACLANRPKKNFKVGAEISSIEYVDPTMLAIGTSNGESQPRFSVLIHTGLMAGFESRQTLVQGLGGSGNATKRGDEH